jgi:hypothetical protein
MNERLQASGGCLTDEGIRILKGAPIGGAPLELARHLSSCLACQRRALAEDVPVRVEGGRVSPPTMRRTLFFLGAILLAAILALFTMVRLR